MEAAKADLEQTRLQVAAEVRRTYWSYYFVGRAIRITEDSQQVLKSLREITETRLRVNQSAQQDVIKVSTEIDILQSKLVTYRQQRDTATAQLNQLLGRDTFAQ